MTIKKVVNAKTLIVLITMIIIVAELDLLFKELTNLLEINSKVLINGESSSHAFAQAIYLAYSLEYFESVLRVFIEPDSLDSIFNKATFAYLYKSLDLHKPVPGPSKEESPI